MKNKIAIIGSGALASALGKVLYDANNKNIIIYGIDKNEIQELKRGFNTKYFSNLVSLPNFKTTNNLKAAIKDSRYIILAVPSKVIDVVFKNILKLLDKKVVIINGSKGFYPNSEFLIHSGLKIESKNNKFIEGIVSIIGPSHAEEIVLEYPTLVAIVGQKMKINKLVYDLFKNNYFKTYIQKDVIGAEVGAAYKNVLAIASGISTGLGFNYNTRAAIISRGLLEMSRFNKAMNGKEKTIYGLTGLGDLIVTATSDLSRNFTFGKKMAKQNKNDDSTTVEGLIALKYIYKIGKTKKLNLPIANSLYNIIYKNKKIEKEINNIWRDNNLLE